jgi:PAS domain S-box-containing protein
MTEYQKHSFYLDACFFSGAFFSLLPVGVVFFARFFGIETLYSPIVLFLYCVVVALALTAMFLRKRFLHHRSELQEQRLQESLQEMRKFKLAVENASDHIVITDADGIIVYANKAVERITGFAPQEVIGKKAGSKELWGGIMEPAFYKKLWKAIKEDREIFRGEIDNVRKNGEKYIALSSIAPVPNDQGEVEFFVGIERDITHEKEIDKAKTEFVSLVSHQLRSPLTAVRWYTEMLVGGDCGSITDKQKESLEEIEKSNQRMTDLVEVFLNVSRIEMGTFSVFPKPIHPKQILDSILFETRDSAGEKYLDITQELPHEDTTYLLDPILFRILAQNLISNAIKYNREKGSVRIRFAQEESGLVFSVSDTGIGIPAQETRSLFTRMFRAQNAVESTAEGTGLGLYIVKEIVERAGGSIEFSSKENVGSVFTIRFPKTGMKKRSGTKALSST